MASPSDVTSSAKSEAANRFGREEEEKEERRVRQIGDRGATKQNEISVRSSSKSIEEVEVNQKDLDRGYAWLILIIMFLLNSTLSGASRVYGIVYAKQVEINYYDREQASWPIATSSTIENLLGILTPALAQFFSWRQIELASTSLFVLSNLLAYFSSSLTLDIISLGLIQGIGLSMNTVIIMSLNNDYFERYRTTAYGIALSGSTFGLLYMNPLTSWILSNPNCCSQASGEAFRNVYLAIACVCLLNYPLIAFVVPRDSKQRSNDEDKGRSKKSICSDSNNNSNSNNGKRSVENGGETYCRKISSCLNNYFARNDSFAFIDLNMCYRDDKYSLSWTRSHSSIFHLANRGRGTLANYFERPISCKQRSAYCTKRSLSANELEQNKAGKLRASSMIILDPSYISCLPSATAADSGKSVSRVGARTLVRVSSRGPTVELSSKQIVPTVSQSVGLAKLPSSNSIERVPKKSVVSFHIDLESNYSAKNTLERSETLCREQSNDKNEKDEEELLFSMELIMKQLKMPCLHCVWMMLTIYYLLSRVFIMIIVDFGKDRNLEATESTSLLNYWSFGEICGRIVLASLIDLRWLSVKNCILITCIFLSLSIFSLVLISDYLVGFYFYAASLTTVAALVSLEYVLINVLLLDYMTSSGKSFSSNCVQITTCYSIGSFISSLLLFARPTLIGLYRDKLGSYDGLLLLLAALPMLFGLLFALIEPSMRKSPK